MFKHYKRNASKKPSNEMAIRTDRTELPKKRWRPRLNDNSSCASVKTTRTTSTTRTRQASLHTKTKSDAPESRRHRKNTSSTTTSVTSATSDNVPSAHNSNLTDDKEPINDSKTKTKTKTTTDSSLTSTKAKQSTPENRRLDNRRESFKSRKNLKKTSSTYSPMPGILILEPRKKGEDLKKNLSPNTSMEETATCTTGFFSEPPFSTTVALSSTSGAPVSEEQKLENQRVIAQETLDRLNLAIEAQEDRERILEFKIRTSVTNAKEKVSAGNLTAALRWMRQKKRDENEQARVNGVIDTLMIQVDSIESTLNQVECLAVMQTGASTMETLKNGGTSVQANTEKAKKLMNNIQDFMHYATQVDEMLSRPLQQIIVTDEELMEELADLPDVSFRDEELLQELTELQMPTVEEREPPMMDDMPTLDRVPILQPQELLAALPEAPTGWPAMSKSTKRQDTF